MLSYYAQNLSIRIGIILERINSDTHISWSGAKQLVRSYGDIKSKFIRTRIKGTSYTFRGYIDELVEVEECILNPPTRWAQALRYHLVREKLSKEWRSIKRELGSRKVEELDEVAANDKSTYDASQLDESDEENRKVWLEIGGVE